MTKIADRVYANDGNATVLAAVPRDVRTALDLGCGAGDNAHRLRDRGVVVDGITLSVAEAESASRFCRHVRVWNLEQGLPGGLDEFYDSVIVSHVLEHLVDPGPVLEGLREKLIPRRGLLILALPNLMHCRYRWRLLRGRFDYEETGIMDSTHVRWYTWKSAQALLVRHGYRIERALSDGFVPLGPVRRMVPRLWSNALDGLLTRRWPGLFGWQMVFLARPI